MMTLNKNLIITQHIYTNLLTACVDFVLTARRCRPVYLHFLPIYGKENNSDIFLNTGITMDQCWSISYHEILAQDLKQYDVIPL